MLCELEMPIWAVIAAEGLPVRSKSTTYTEAVNRRQVLKDLGAEGLVIVTDETALRIKEDARTAETV